MATPIRPPLTTETARAKVQAAQDAWNARDPERVPLAHAEDARWRNRDQFFQGRAAIVASLRHEWAKELDYRPWKFRQRGLMRRHDASINDYRIGINDYLIAPHRRRIPRDE